ncbi:hypothetical protein A0J61_00553 [Choanephora cucurbitarum]|uniref:Zn(2)-C6 fungal-type domain-containing protein n=1 Tax=Choanephora cucurbitarum TaxID=101091 RepID=A0A1C7NSE3_9FUNG|nr:hypothetical protein A0J61_00553 [Choanephora cucurbitarum]
MLYNNDNITATAAETTNVQMPVDKTRRKRLKVVSACSECRRKKTKCNGEKPCAGCIKTNVDCKYANSTAKTKQQKQQTQRPQLQTQVHQPKPQPQPQPQRSLASHDTILQVQPQTSCSSEQQQNEKTTAMIQAIEQRLSVIEDILQVFLANSNLNKQNSVPQHYHYQHSAAGPYHGDYYLTNKRKYSDYYSQDDSLKLPPPHNYQPTLSESSSTSTTSSVCSTGSSPKISAIQTLLNNDSKSNEDYSTKRPSAFFRPAPSNHTIASGAGSPPVIVHHRDYYSTHGPVTGSV